MIMRRFISVIIIIIGIAGLVLPVIPGALLIALGVLLFSGRDWRVIYRKLRMSIKGGRPGRENKS